MLESRRANEVTPRLIGWLYVAIGVAGLISVVLGADAETNRRAVVVIALASMTVGFLGLGFARTVPPALFAPALVACIAVIGGYTTASGEVDSPHLLLYGWLCAVAWLCLPARSAVAITGAAIVTSGALAAILHGPDQDGDTWWTLNTLSLMFISGLAGVLRARARETVQLGDQAIRDELTGLLNRRGYRQRLDAELSRASRYRSPVSLILGDLDHFKKLNDRYGHAAGDQALTSFARTCVSELRDIDFACRVGGEEFAIVLPNTTCMAAVSVAERLRRAVAARPGDIAITVSFGVACFPHDSHDADTLLAHADRAMYQAKALGRDRVAVYGDQQDHGPGE